MASLLDQFGNPIKREDLTKEEATPTMSGVRSVMSSYQTGGLNPRRLAAIIQQANNGDATAYLELAEEVEEKDTHYVSVLGTRKRAVAQLDISVIPASDDKADIDNAKIIEDWLDRDQLETELFNILDAVGKGFSVTEILWDINSSIWLPQDLKWRDPRWFEFDPNDGETLYLKTEDGEKKPLNPIKYLIHKAQSKSGIPIRGGVIRPCVWMWLFKNFSIKDWVAFSEVYGQPIRLGKYGAGASAKDRDVLLRAVANIGSDAAAIIPESMTIEFIESAIKGSTVDAFERLCKFCDQQISKAVLGQTTTTDALSSGLAGNQAHNDVRGDIERSDAKQLAATINQQLIPMIISLNKGPQKRYPRIQIGRGDVIDIDKLSLAAERGVKMGMPISASKLRDKLGLPTPEDDKDILQIPSGPTDAPQAATATSRQKPELATDAGTSRDGIDDVVDELSGDWEEIMTPLVDQIDAAIAECATLEEAKQKLAELSATIRTKELAKKSDTSINLRLAGMAGVPLGEE